MLKMYLLISFPFLILLSACNTGPEVKTDHVYNVMDFGAKGDGVNLDTESINLAIDSCSGSGGGTVLFPEGTYLTGSIHLADNITLEISKDAIILGAANDIEAYDFPEENPWSAYQDFGHSHFRNALIWGEELNHITITGGGTIDGGGITRSNDVPEGGGDKAISLKLCKNITIKNLRILQGGHFAILANGCDSLWIDSLYVETPRDGIDLMSCNDVSIRRSEIISIRYDENGHMAGGDDAIGIKSDYALGFVRHCENIHISDCFLSSGTNAIQFGSETVGNMKNVVVENCSIVHSDKAGLGITCNDGSIIENVVFRNITMSKVANPFYMVITDRGRSPENRPVGQIKNIRFEKITCTDAYGYIKQRKFTSTISGLPGHPIEDVRFRNISVTYKGGGTRKQSEIEPPYTKEYAPRVLGTRPASGFYCRHASNLVFANTEIKYEEKEERPAFVMKDISSLQFDNVQAENSAHTQADIILDEVTGIEILNSELLKVIHRSLPE